MSPGLFCGGGGVWLSSWYVVSIDAGHSSVWPKMESCFQDRACSVCFLLHSQLQIRESSGLCCSPSTRTPTWVHLTHHLCL